MHDCAVTMTWTYYVSRLHSFNTLRIHLSRNLLLLDILIFVKYYKGRHFSCIKRLGRDENNENLFVKCHLNSFLRTWETIIFSLLDCREYQRKAECGMLAITMQKACMMTLFGVLLCDHKKATPSVRWRRE